MYVSYYIIYLIIYKERTKANREGRVKAQTEQKREEQGKGCRLHPRQFLASLPFRPLSEPSEPSPALTPHPIAPAPRERGKSGHPAPALGDVIATTSPANNRGSSPAGAVYHPAASRLRPSVHCLTFCPPSCTPLPLCQVVRGRADHQPGQAIPSRSSCRPSPPPAGASAYWRTPQEIGEGCAKPYQGGEARPCDSKFREFLRGCIALNINYLFSPKGLAVQSQRIVEIVIILKVENITI